MQERTNFQHLSPYGNSYSPKERDNTFKKSKLDKYTFHRHLIFIYF